MRWYLDASVALYAILPGGGDHVQRWLDAAHARGETVFSSSLLQLELTRTLRREQLSPARALPVIRRVDMVSIDDGVLRLAAAIEPHVKSLDAIHFATCSQLGNDVSMVTHDDNMAEVAQALGFPVHDPLVDER